MKRIVLLVVWLSVLCAARTAAQPVRSITLAEAVDAARTQSVDAAVALNELKCAYWEYRTFRADLLPEVNFSGRLPGYTKNYNPYQQDDGSYTFLRSNYMDMSGVLSLDQNIWFTGGKLSLTTSLDYMKQLGGDRAQRFMSVPVALTLEQPVFGVNRIRWNRRIEPVRYAEAKAAFLSATEEVTMTTIARFFNLLLAKEQVGISTQNLKNAETLYEVAKAKREMGQISENDLLQLEQNVLEARSAQTENESLFKSDMFALRSFLALDSDEELDPVLPDSLPRIRLCYEEVLEKALANNAFAKNIVRRRLEADYEVAKAKGDRRQITLFARVGLTGTGRGLDGAYRTMKTNQVFELGLNIPLLDWGKRKGKVRVAESNREVIAGRLRQEEQEFRQNIFILVEHFNNQQRQLELAAAADRIARRRYETNVQAFVIGRISTLDLNDSQTRKDEARRKLINEMFLYWHYYYQVRSLTLWDFVKRSDIGADFERIVRQ